VKDTERLPTDIPPPLRANKMKKIIIADITETQLKEIMKILSKNNQSLKLYQ
jgi:hypothetical protein